MIAVVGGAGEAAIVLVLVVEPLEDRMHQMAIDAEGAEFQLGVVEPDRRDIGEPQGVDVALLVDARR